MHLPLPPHLTPPIFPTPPHPTRPLQDARKVRDFVRASVVGPVRDAALFCRGDGINEPAFCDPRGFARKAATMRSNTATIAQVISSTKGWASGGERWGSGLAGELRGGCDGVGDGCASGT